MKNLGDREGEVDCEIIICYREIINKNLVTIGILQYESWCKWHRQFLLKNLGAITCSWFCECIDGIVQKNEDSLTRLMIIPTLALSDWRYWTRLSDLTGLLFFVSEKLFSTFILLFLPSFSVSLSYFNLAVPMRECLGKHPCMSSPFSIAILNVTYSLRAPILVCGDVPAVK